MFGGAPTSGRKKSPRCQILQQIKCLESQLEELYARLVSLNDLRSLPSRPLLPEPPFVNAELPLRWPRRLRLHKPRSVFTAREDTEL